MNNADIPTTPALAVTPGMRVRILGEDHTDAVYTITEVNPVGKTGKQFRCALLCDKTGVTLTGIAPSRLAPPYAAKGPKTYHVEGFQFRPEAVDYLPHDADICFHPAMYLAGMLKAPVAVELLDLIVEAAEKGTPKAHCAVVMFCVDRLPNLTTPTPPKTFLDKLRYGFDVPATVNYEPFLLLATAKIHEAAFRYGSK